MIKQRMGLALILSAFGLGIAGCGDGISFAEVTGTIKAKGVALDGIQVEFFPSVKGPPSIAITDKQGKYVLKTEKGPGAAVGKHKVVLKDTTHFTSPTGKIGRMNEDIDLGKGKPVRLPAAVSDLGTTTIEKDVVSGNNKIDLDL